MTSIYIFKYLQAFSTNASKNDVGGLDTIADTPLQDNVWPQNLYKRYKRCKKDKNLKLESLNGLANLMVML